MQIIVINKKIKKIAESACKHMLECSSKNPSLTVEKVKSARKPLFKV